MNTVLAIVLLGAAYVSAEAGYLRGGYGGYGYGGYGYGGYGGYGRGYYGKREADAVAEAEPGYSRGYGGMPVLGLELLSEVHGVVDEGEPSGLATSELCLEPEGEATVGGAGVHLSQLLPHI